jgi:membrane complex biogenesis BtpA family protein
MPAQLVPAGAVIGVIHLPPLPGSPRPGPEREALLDRALYDAEALAQGGAAGCVIENLGDAPFAPDRVEPHVVAHMAVIASAVTPRFGRTLRIGINVLRNAGLDALGVASAVGADFVRINVLSGAMVTDQGLIQGQARELMLYRRRLGLGCMVAADVLVKHASPLGELGIEQAARDTFHRGGADVLIVTGAGTGLATDPQRLAQARQAVPTAPLWLGSGLTPDNAARYRPHCDAAIVGTWLHRDADLTQPLEAARVRRVVEAFGG